MRVNRTGRAGEMGLVLIELLVAMAVMLAGVVGIAGTFAALEKSSAITQRQADLEAAMRQLSDFVRSPSALLYAPCASASTYNSVLPGAPAGISWSIQNVYVSVSRTGTISYAAVGTCASGTDYGVQEITLRVSDATRSLQRVVFKGQV